MKRGQLLTRPPAGYTQENLGVWVSEGGDSFVIEFPGGPAVDPDEDEDEDE